MSSLSDDSPRREQLQEVICAYLEALNAGQAPDRQELLARHPDLAGELEAFFADHDRFQQLAAPAAAQTASGLPDETLRVPPPAEGSFLREYHLQERLAGDEVESVYRAWQVRLERHVLVRVIALRSLPGKRSQARLLRQVKAATGLEHAHLVPTYEVREEDDNLYVVQELTSGGSLADRSHPMPPRQAARLVRDLARAVHHAHRRGLVHGSLKPGSIRWSPGKPPRISGLGRSVLLRAREPGAASSSGYRAPEQVLGTSARPDRAVDIYALGAILKELLTGRSPPSPSASLERSAPLRPSPPKPSFLNRLLERWSPAGVPRRLQTICQKCLEHEPSERYPTAAALASDLSVFLSGGRAREVRQALSRIFRDDAAPVAVGATLFSIVFFAGLALVGVENAFQIKLPHLRSLWSVALFISLGCMLVLLFGGGKLVRLALQDTPPEPRWVKAPLQLLTGAWNRLPLRGPVLTAVALGILFALWQSKWWEVGIERPVGVSPQPHPQQVSSPANGPKEGEQGTEAAERELYFEQIALADSARSAGGSGTA